jgi:hypothetical protein
VRRGPAAALVAACAALASCAAVEVTEDAAGRRPASLEVHPPRAVLLPARIDADGRAVASRLAWIPDGRRPLRVALRPGAGTARLRVELRDEDGWTGWLTRFESGADARAPAAIEAAGRLARAALEGAATAAGGR